jgi:hypothetical protein
MAMIHQEPREITMTDHMASQESAGLHCGNGRFERARRNRHREWTKTLYPTPIFRAKPCLDPLEP